MISPKGILDFLTAKNDVRAALYMTKITMEAENTEKKTILDALVLGWTSDPEMNILCSLSICNLKRHCPAILLCTFMDY